MAFAVGLAIGVVYAVLVDGLGRISWRWRDPTTWSWAIVLVWAGWPICIGAGFAYGYGASERPSGPRSDALRSARTTAAFAAALGAGLSYTPLSWVVGIRIFAPFLNGMTY